MLNNNKGITLISLTITIIILLIIASVSTISGISAIRYIKYTDAKSQFEVMQSKVNEWYKQWNNDADSKVLDYGKSIDECDRTKLAITASGKDLTGYRYFSAEYIKNDLDIQGINYDFLINVKTYSVLLYGGIVYQNKSCSSAEDFGIHKIQYDN